MSQKIIITNSEKQTFNLGKKLGAKLSGGEVLALNGELGAGKTVLIKGIAAGLGVKQIITSPTFVIMKVYKIPPRKSTSYKLQAKKLIHIDCYRVREADAIAGIGALDYFGKPDTVAVVEWADYIKPILPKVRINITIRLKGDNKRGITIT